MASGKRAKMKWRSKELIKLIRSLQPEIIINDDWRLTRTLRHPNSSSPATWVHINGKPVVWEACQTLSGSWGYHRDEESWKISGATAQNAR